MGKKEVQQKALRKLRYGKRLSLDRLSEIFCTFVKEFHDIEPELTNEELHELFSKKKAQKKDEMLRLLRKLDHLKYHVEEPSRAELKELSQEFVGYVEKLEVQDNEKKESFWKKLFGK